MQIKAVPEAYSRLVKLTTYFNELFHINVFGIIFSEEILFGLGTRCE